MVFTGSCQMDPNNGELPRAIKNIKRGICLLKVFLILVSTVYTFLFFIYSLDFVVLGWI